MAKRTPIGKRLRFEVFKRDGFVCQYCGAHPPNVVLHVDHIVPVAGGGDNSIDNLLTSCAPCNLGKGARDLNVAPSPMSDLKERAADMAERERQLRGWYEVMEARRKRVERDAWEVAELLLPGCSKKGLPRDYFSSIKLFNDELTKPVVIESAGIALDKYAGQGARTFLYFCGICRNKMRVNKGA